MTCSLKCPSTSPPSHTLPHSPLSFRIPSLHYCAVAPNLSYLSLGGYVGLCGSSFLLLVSPHALIPPISPKLDPRHHPASPMPGESLSRHFPTSAQRWLRPSTQQLRAPKNNPGEATGAQKTQGLAVRQIWSLCPGQVT